jgi:hypothetical protein
MSFIGVEIETFANGCFGRDSYGRKVVVAEGLNWITVIDYSFDEKGFASSANFSSEEEKKQCIEDWIEQTERGDYT